MSPRLTEPLTMGLYWKGTCETPAESAPKLRTVLDAAAGVSPLLSGWRPRGGNNTAESIAQPQYVLDDLEQLLENHRVNPIIRDNGEVVEMGCSFGGWNGNPPASCEFSCWLGAASDDLFLLEWAPLSSPGVAPIFEAALDLFKLAITQFRPDWALVDSWDLHEAIDRRGYNTPGWLTYFGARRKPFIPADLNAEPFLDGALISLADRWENVTDHDAKTLATTLRDAGALFPLRKSPPNPSTTTTPK